MENINESSVHATQTIKFSRINDDSVNFVRMVQKIVEREKENQHTVKTLQEMIKKDRRRCIELKLELKIKETTIAEVTRGNDVGSALLQRAIDDLKWILEKKQPKCKSDKEIGTAEEEGEQKFDAILTRLKQILQDLLDDTRKKEEYLQNNPLKRSCDQKPDELEMKQYECNDLEEFLKGLQELQRDWIRKVTDTLRCDDDTGSILTFNGAILKIIKFSDLYANVEKEYERLKKLVDELMIKKKKLHDELAKRIKARKSLDRYPGKIRLEFEKVRKKRDECDPLPDIKKDVGIHLTNLYKWGCDEYFRGEDYLNESLRLLKGAKNKDEEVGKKRQPNIQSKDDEIQKFTEKLAKLRDNNEKLQKMIEIAKQNAGQKNTNTLNICKEIKETINLNQCRPPNVQKLNREIENETQKRREIEEAINRLECTKARQEDEMKRLEEQIRDEFQRNKEMQGRCRNPKALENLENLRKKKEVIVNQRNQNPGRPKKIATQKIFNEAQKRRIERLEKTLQNMNNKLKDMVRDCEELRRRLQQLECDIRSFREDLKRKTYINDQLEIRLDEEINRLRKLKVQLNDEQEKSRIILKHQNGKCSNRQSGEFDFYNKDETQISSSQTAIQHCYTTEESSKRLSEGFAIERNETQEGSMVSKIQQRCSEEIATNAQMVRQDGKNEDMNELRFGLKKLTRMVENLEAKIDSNIRMQTSSYIDEGDDDESYSSSQASRMSSQKDKSLVLEFFMPQESQSSQSGSGSSISQQNGSSNAQRKQQPT